MKMKLIKTIHHKGEASNSGLEAYVEKHGYHFTERLADKVSTEMVNADATSHTWSCNEVGEALGDKLSGRSTIGDAAYLANMAYADFYPDVIKTEGGCLQYALAVINDVDGYEGMAFRRWLTDAEAKHEDVDWGNYI